MMPYLGGQLLVATPELDDPNFRRAVILVLDHNEGGAIGVVLTNPSGAFVAEHLPAAAAHVCEPPLFFVGGPVAEGSVVALARDGGAPMLYELDGLLDGTREPPRSLRLYAGYSGWCSGQLEAEIATGSWIVVDSLDTDAFSEDSETLWRAVLRRQSGPVARLALYPDNVMSN